MPISFEYKTLNTCHTATGTVVVVDVLRAFTAAAYAFTSGARSVALVDTLEKAFDLKSNFPGALIYGENFGRRVEGFDFGNSPSELAGQDLSGRQLIQRTSAGTQGVVRSAQAEHLLAGSFVCAEATVRAIRQLAPPTVTFVITGIFKQRDGDEDLACADYMCARLRGESPDPTPYLERVSTSTAGQLFASPNEPDHPAQDLRLAAELDRFDFAMQVHRRNGLHLLEKFTPQ